MSGSFVKSNLLSIASRKALYVLKNSANCFEALRPIWGIPIAQINFSNVVVLLFSIAVKILLKIMGVKYLQRYQIIQII